MLKRGLVRDNAAASSVTGPAEFGSLLPLGLQIWAYYRELQANLHNNI